MKSRALITGASSGIGFSYAKYLRNQGWYLDLVSQNKERLKESKENLKYTNSSFHSTDLSKIESVKYITKNFQTPDLIVANAGIAVNGAIGKLDEKEKNDAYYLMCGGVIDLIEGFVPKMIKNGGGRIVIISFHSLEDRIVKNFINKHSDGKNIISKLPIANLNKNLSLKKIKLPLKASEVEIKKNIRARSARIRVAEKL